MTLFGSISKFFNKRPITNIPSRAATHDELYRRMLDNAAHKLRVAMPAKVVSYDILKQTIVAQPLIREKIIDRTTGSIQWHDLPEIPDVPILYPRGGGFALTHPILPGDEVQLQFQDSCMDSWWEFGGIQNWNDKRRHDLSDAIAIPGISSQPNLMPLVSEVSIELRSVDGTTRFGVTNGAFYFIVDGNPVLSWGEEGFKIAWDESHYLLMNDSGTNIIGGLKIDGYDYYTHKHTGVNPGVGTSGTVLP